MLATLIRLRAAALQYRFQTALIAASAGAMFAFTTIGVRMRRSVEPVRREAARLSAQAAEIAQFRAAFVPSPPEHQRRLSELVDSLGVATARDNRVALAQQVAARAEALGVSGVRVWFTPLDSATSPQRPAPSSTTIAVADYALTLDGNGSLEAVLLLLRQLPPSVALERLGAVKGRAAAQYRLTFAVFESTATGGSQNSSAQLAELISFAKPLSDSAPTETFAIASAPLPRDPFDQGIAHPVVRLAARSSRSAPTVDVPVWDVSATLIAGERRAALINGVLISVGEAAPGGVTLTAVQRDRVVLTDQKGAAHTIAVKEGER